jgi:hypothetical protein
MNRSRNAAVFHVAIRRARRMTFNADCCVSDAVGGRHRRPISRFRECRRADENRPRFPGFAAGNVRKRIGPLGASFQA